MLLIKDLKMIAIVMVILYTVSHYSMPTLMIKSNVLADQAIHEIYSLVKQVIK